MFPAHSPGRTTPLLTIGGTTVFSQNFLHEEYFIYTYVLYTCISIEFLKIYKQNHTHLSLLYLLTHLGNSFLAPIKYLLPFCELLRSVVLLISTAVMISMTKSNLGMEEFISSSNLQFPTTGSQGRNWIRGYEGGSLLGLLLKIQVLIFCSCYLAWSLLSHLPSRWLDFNPSRTISQTKLSLL